MPDCYSSFFFSSSSALKEQFFRKFYSIIHTSKHYTVPFCEKKIEPPVQFFPYAPTYPCSKCFQNDKKQEFLGHPPKFRQKCMSFSLFKKERHVCSNFQTKSCKMLPNVSDATYAIEVFQKQDKILTRTETPLHLTDDQVSSTEPTDALVCSIPGHP